MLFAALARGEPAALDEVCRRYGPRVRAIARRRLFVGLRAKLESGDVAQEAMLEVVRGAPGLRFDSEEEFLHWVRRVVEHKVLSLARRFRAARRRAERERRLSTTLERADPRQEPPSRLLDRRERLQQLSAALGDLSAEDREAVILRHLLKLPWSSVAAGLGSTEEAAQMRCLRARRRLAKRLSRLA